ncbi:MAG: metal ABC transporter substrate-binding protein [Candidatus Sumerlaeaceae bacterium]|nr:metal ABC transporter substrate-binding protein [Candidatus Sumerlaeaceae bacterium]
MRTGTRPQVWLRVAAAVLIVAAPLSVAAAEKIQVVATIPPLADWVKQVGGDRVEVATLIPTGASAHTFEPSPREMRVASRAALIVRVGLQMDDWGARIGKAAAPHAKMLDLGDMLKAAGQLPDLTGVYQPEIVASSEDRQSPSEHHVHGPGCAHHHEGGVDPHFWLDPVLAKISVGYIADALAKLDPARAEVFKKNAERYSAQLDELDAEVSATLSAAGGRAFASFHNAFSYLAKRYGLTLAAVIEEYPGKTPSDRYIKTVVDALRRRQIKTVFAEPQLSPRAAEIIAAEIGGRVDVLDPYGSSDYPDRDTYAKLMRYNAARLKEALSGNP